MGMPTEAFLHQVLYLQKYYRIVNLSQAIELLRSGKVRVPTVALTFDDGYADNFLNLRAVANEVGIPATLFITTHPVEAHQEFGHDLTNGMTGFLPLTWEQIQYWSTRGVEFGSHTRTHMDCGTPDLAKLHWEIVGSKDDLETQLGKSVDLFAFPYGQRENMSSEAMRLATSAYSHFVSSYGGEAPSSCGKNLQPHLFRKSFYPSQWEMEMELQSVFDFAGAIRRLFSRGEKVASHKDSQVAMAPKLTESMSAAPNQNFAERPGFRQASEGTGYRSSVR
jgi:peptidoglycan/xylan/chitin deacetylase (PgdA/CDA1 family)